VYQQSSSKFYSTVRNLNLLLFTFFILVTQHVSAYLQAIFRHDQYIEKTTDFQRIRKTLMSFTE
jgi:hypothetical protein